MEYQKLGRTDLDVWGQSKNSKVWGQKGMGSGRE